MIFLLSISLIVFLFYCPGVSSAPNLKIKVGMLMPMMDESLKTTMGWTTSASAVVIALDRIREEHLLDQVDFEFAWYDDMCQEAVALGMGVKLVNEDKVDVVIAPPCSSGAAVVGMMGKFYNLPVVGWGAIFYELGDMARYPTFSRTIISSDDLGRGIAETMIFFGWSQYALFYTNDGVRNKCYYIKQGIDKIFSSDQYSLVNNYQLEINGTPTVQKIRSFLTTIKLSARIIIACLDNVDDERTFMLEARKMGMDNDEYVYIIPDVDDKGAVETTQTSSKSTIDLIATAMRWTKLNGNDGLDIEAREAYKKALIISVNQTEDDEVIQFKKEVIERMKKAPFNCTICNGPNDQYGSAYSPYLHDAMYLYALALNRTLGVVGMDHSGSRNGTLITKYTAVNFNGITGNVSVDRNGNRLPKLVMRGIDGQDNYRDFASIDPTLESGKTVELLVSSITEMWSGRKNGLPLSLPICGYSGVDCPKDYTVFIVIGSCIGAVILLISIGSVGYSIYSRHLALKRENELWQVSATSLKKIDGKEGRDATNNQSQSSMNSGNKSNNSSVLDSIRKGITARKSKNYEFYLLNGQPVAAAKQANRIVFKGDSDYAEFRTMRALAHENINRFIGLCLDGPAHMALWKFCSRGSLKDVIGKGHLTLDWFFKYSIISDIASGLEYLISSPLKYHGNLTSRTCVIDDRWNVCLSDFGLHTIRQNENLPAEKLLWTAPELLRQEQQRVGTPEGDIYSLAIIMSEIITTKKAFADRELDVEGAEGVIYFVKKGARGNQPFRPKIPFPTDPDMNPAIIYLITDCWSENPDERPSIKMVRTILKGMMKGKNANLMDHVLQMMEKYAGSLEEQVEERTKQLVEEQKKSDVLLYRMLPRQVAEKLKMGQSVEPEAFEFVTIMFSDVVGFTKIAAQCSPLQVVNLLNDLYTLFDSIIDEYDVYKVETIGDGYLCVSGLPHRNGDMHAREIADMSLALTRCLNGFIITNLPSEKINLRIGVHTGPCVAGVVGMSMPRYCLFGDSVNTASRMESHGKSQHIHITEETKMYLTEIIGGYAVVSRGEVIIKGKGVMETYWLLGRAENAKATSRVSSSRPRIAEAEQNPPADAENEAMLPD
uniref:Guanylate cyclase n=1 Tax=Plectus sambesii TaxID=2011161 RepID=A0A914VG19_9BILA